VDRKRRGRITKWNQNCKNN